MVSCEFLRVTLNGRPNSDVGDGGIRKRTLYTDIVSTPHGEFGLFNGRTRKNCTEKT